MFTIVYTVRETLKTFGRTLIGAIRQTFDSDLRVDHDGAAELIHCDCVALKSQVCVYIKFHIYL